MTAYYEGDSTAKDLGYFTLNPLVHLGKISLLFLLLTGMCWGHRPINPSKFRHKYGDALVSFAGPFAHLLIMTVSSLLCMALAAPWPPQVSVPLNVQHNLAQFLNLAAYTNAYLFIVFMLPIPPMDGHRILGSFFPPIQSIFNKIGNGSIVLLIVLIMIPGVGATLREGAKALSDSSLFFWGGLLGL